MSPRSLVLVCLAGTPALGQVPSVHGLIWGGNVAGGSWYLRDTPSFTGQPCYYIESNGALHGWGGVASTYGGLMCRVGDKGSDGQGGVANATSGWFDSLTITAPGIRPVHRAPSRSASPS
jgi:hypothetical protein